MSRKADLQTAGSEKLTINLGVVDLGKIDLLVQEGFYSNRSDLIRTAVREHLLQHADVIATTVKRRHLVLGMHAFTRAELEAVRAKGASLSIQVLGLARIDDDVSPALARATLRSINVLGVLHAAPAVMRALQDRIR